MSNKNQSQNPSAKGGGGGYPTACYFFAANFEQKSGPFMPQNCIFGHEMHLYVVLLHITVNGR